MEPPLPPSLQQKVTALRQATRNITAVRIDVATDPPTDQGALTLEDEASALILEATALIEALRPLYGHRGRPGTLLRQIRRALGYTYP